MDNNTLKIKVTVAGADQAKSQLQGVQNTVKSSTGSIAGDVFKANVAFEALKVGIGMAVQGIQTFASTAANVIGNSVKMADSLQQNRIAFETMLSSADKAKELLTALDKFATQTPFNLTQLQDLTKQLLAYGIQQKDIIPDLTTLGNIAAGVGMDKLPNLVLAFGQVKTATKLTGMELRQFTEAGVGVVEALQDYYSATGKSIKVTKDMSASQIENAKKVQLAQAKIATLIEKQNELKATGKATKSQLMAINDQIANYQSQIDKASTQTVKFTSTMDLSGAGIRDMVEKGLVSFDDLNNALAKIAGKGGRYDNLMGKQMKTFSGMQSNLEDFKDRFLRTLGGITVSGDIIKGGLLDVLGENLGKLLQFIDDHSPEIQGFMEMLSKGIGDKLTQGFTFITEHRSEIEGFFKTLAEKIPIIADKIPGMVDNFKTLGEGLKDLSPKLKPIVENIGSFALSLLDIGGASIGTIGNAMQSVVARSEGKTAEIDKINKQQQKLNESTLYSILGNFGLNKAQVDEGLMYTVKAFDQMGKNIQNSVSNTFNGVKNSILNALTTVKNFVVIDLPNAFIELANKIKNAFANIPNSIKDAMNAMIGKIEYALTQITRTMRSIPFAPWIDDPHIGRLEKGTQYFGGGMAMVGEKGAEIVNLPKGSSVTSTNESEAMLVRAFEKALKNVFGNGGKSVNFNAPITFGGQRGEMQEQNQFINLLLSGI